MGKLLLCSHKLALVPYYLETMALNIYSLEELCCYLKQNIELVESSFMDDGLILWIEKEAGLTGLAEQLREKREARCGLSEFVTHLASGCSYLSGEEVRTMQNELAGLEKKSRTERRKIRADHLLKKKRYGASILEYRKLLDEPEVTGMFAGDIWHNLGTAYAGLFYFEEAAACYKKAFAKNKNTLSRKQYETALLMAKEGAFQKEREDGMAKFPEGVLEQWKEDYLRECR